MKKINIRVLMTAAVLLLMTSCGYFSQFSNTEHARQLRVGMSKEEVLALMGEPIRGKQYCKPDIWFYYVETRWFWDCQSTRDECMPVVFKDGKVAGLGVEYYKSHILFPETTEKAGGQ